MPFTKGASWRWRCEITRHHTIGTTSRPGSNGDATALWRGYIDDMNMLRALLAPLAVIALTLPAQAEKIPLGDISAYLNSLTTAESDFTQVNADGSISTGKLFIKRPGRVRFEYAPPDDSLVMAGGGQVAIFDAKSNQPPEQYPLSRTPLNLILRESVDLSRARMVVGHDEVENATRVLAQDPDHPEYGTIQLVFTANPVELRQWVITDDLGSQTTVILGEMRKGGDLPPSLFNITTEQDKRNR
jgi:outer membrane lipoprotein-sorting protein